MKKIISVILALSMLLSTVTIIYAEDISDIEIPNGTILECYTDEDIQKTADMLFKYLDPKTDTARDALKLYKAGQYKNALVLFRNYMIDRIRQAPMNEILANINGYGQAIWHNTIDVICGDMTIDEFNEAHKSHSSFVPLEDSGHYLDYIDYTQDSHIDWTAKASEGKTALPVPSYAGLCGRFAHKYATTGDERVIKRYFQIMYDYSMNYRDQIEAPMEGMSEAEKTLYAQETDGRVYIRLGGKYASANLDFVQKANDIVGSLGVICKALPSEESNGKSFKELCSDEAVFEDKLSEESYDLIDPVRFAGLCGHLMKNEMYRVGGYISCGAITNQKTDGLSAYFRYAALFSDFTPAWEEIDLAAASINSVIGSTYHTDGGILEKSLNYNTGDANSRGYLRAFVMSMNSEMAEKLKDYSGLTTMWNRLAEGYKSNLGIYPSIGNLSNRGTYRIWENASQKKEIEKQTASNRELGYTSVYYPYSGYAAMRNNWEVDGLYMSTYNNPNVYSGHHSAAVNAILNLSAYGRTMLLSGGTAWYGRSYCSTYTDFLKSGYDEINGYFSENSGRKNSTVMVNNRSQQYEDVTEISSTEDEKILNNRWYSSDSFDFTEGTWSGGYTYKDCEEAIYKSYPAEDKITEKSAEHNRQIVFLKELDMWVVLDKAENKNNSQNEYTQVWNFAQYQENSSYADGKGGYTNEQVAYDENAKTISTCDPSGPNLFMMNFSNKALTYEKKYGEFIKGQTAWGWSTGGGSNYIKTGGFAPSVDMLVKWKDSGESGESSLVATVLAPSENSDNTVIKSEDLSTENYIGFSIEKANGSVVYYSSDTAREYRIGDMSIKAKTVLVQTTEAGIKGVALDCDEFNGAAAEYKSFEFEGLNAINQISVPESFAWAYNAENKYIPAYNNEQLCEISAEDLDLSSLETDFAELNRYNFDEFVGKYWAYFKIDYDEYKTVDYPEYIYDKLSEYVTLENFGKAVNEEVSNMKITHTEYINFAVEDTAELIKWPAACNTYNNPLYVGFNIPVGAAIERADIVSVKTNANNEDRSLKIDRYIAADELPSLLEFNASAEVNSDLYNAWHSFAEERQTMINESLSVNLTFRAGEVQNDKKQLPSYILDDLNKNNNYLILRMYGGNNMAIKTDKASADRPLLSIMYDKSAVYKALENYKTHSDAVKILREAGENADKNKYTVTDVDVTVSNNIKSVNSVTVCVNNEADISEPMLVTAIYNSETDVLENVRLTDCGELKNKAVGESAAVPVDGCFKNQDNGKCYFKVFIIDFNKGFMPLADSVGDK